MHNKNRYLYAFVIFLSAFLIFQVQPMISKYILPWFGGTASVWTVCMLFFQVILFGGYLYAHFITSRNKPLVQFIVHGSLLLISTLLVIFRTILPVALKPAPGGDPVFQILFILIITIGLPYFTLAATSPLLQYWFAGLNPGKEPYILYALSNIGSLFALISYPVVVEPFLPLNKQSGIWSTCFAIFAAGCSIVAWLFLMHSRKGKIIPGAGGAADMRAAAGSADKPDKNIKKISRIKKAQAGSGLFENISWIVLPMLSTLLLLAFTNQLGTDVSSGPFIWIVPLSIYLISFIFTFAGWRFVYNRTVFFCLLVAGFIVISCFLQEVKNFPFFVHTILYSTVLYCACIAAHGELYRLRPQQGMLTKYYLFISLGGAIGGIFVGMAAQFIFNDFYELQISSITLLIWIIVCAYRDKGFFKLQNRSSNPKLKRTLVFMTSALLTIGTAAAFLYQVAYKSQYNREMKRSFFGIVRVKEYPHYAPGVKEFRLVHGPTFHGAQISDPSRRNWPTTYYGSTSGVGIALTQYARTSALRVGAIGLGIGTIASYAQSKDIYRFYEINPDIISLADDERYFHYLEDARKRGALIEIITGDARLSMEAETGKQQPYDVIVLDAFSSDAIPVHLLTKEAFACYFRLLKENGIIAVHITNSNLDLSPVIAAISDHYHIPAIALKNVPDYERGVVTAAWILLTNNPYFLKNYYKSGLPGKRNLWTDDFSNLFSIMKFQF